MSDPLVDLAANPAARKWVGRLGLPIPMPQKLERLRGPREAHPLADRKVFVGGQGDFTEALAAMLPRLGATTIPLDLPMGPFEQGGEGWSRPPQLDGEQKAHAFVFDGTGITDVAGLRAVYDTFHPRVKRLERCAKVVVISRRHTGLKAQHAAAQRALEGFTRSIARELGRRGGTANLIVVQDGAEERLEPVLRFLTTPASVFVDSQVLHVSKTVRNFEDQAVRPLDGKVVLVTGAARGIGKATAKVLAAEGARVIVLDRPEDDGPASEAAASVGGTVVLGDVTSPETGPRLVQHIQEHYDGQLHGIVHNAGITRDKTLAKMRPELWDLTMQVNLAAVIELTEALDGVLAKNARLVCLSSIAGIAGNVGQTNYSASKAGVIGFVEAMAPRFARRGIALNAIAPGFIETRLTDAIPVATREGARRLSCLAQGGLPSDVGQAITFLTTPGAGALCGQILRVCGGHFTGA